MIICTAGHGSMGAPNTRSQSIRVAVVIATRNRHTLLRDRSIPSVVRQSRRPDYLIVVDDSDGINRPKNAALVSSLELPSTEVVYLENSRSRGASGAWNTALEFLLQNDQSDLFVALLDDDDAWHPDYLNACLAHAFDHQLNMVAAAVRRIEGPEAPPIILEPPRTLDQATFLIGNPGIQGSNLFLRISLILRAGGFDEALPSTTDRDLCIRLCELPDVRYGQIPMPLVESFAEPGRDRLSRYGSTEKLRGLSAFARKYASRMTTEQRAAFAARASGLFGWAPGEDPNSNSEDSRPANDQIVSGIWVDAGADERFSAGVRDAMESGDLPQSGCFVVMASAAHSAGSRASVASAVARLRVFGVDCYLVPHAGDYGDAQDGVAYHACTRESEPSEEAGRELRRYVAAVASHRTVAGASIFLALCVTRQTPVSEIRAFLLGDSGSHRAVAYGPVGNQHGLPAQDGMPEDWLQRERIANASVRLRSQVCVGELRLLGFGAEAVVFTDGTTVFKCLDDRLGRRSSESMAFLASRIGAWAGLPGLYRLLGAHDFGTWTLITYPFESSKPFEGGRESDMVALLQSCAAAGIVCNNLHPKNLIQTDSEVKLIDYGADIVDWSERGFEHMARRAFVSDRFALHPELGELLRRCLHEEDLPAMSDYAAFRAKVGVRTALPQARTGVRICVGVISSDADRLRGLLADLVRARQSHELEHLSVILLINTTMEEPLLVEVRRARELGLLVAVCDVAQQRIDALAGRFGPELRTRPEDQLPIVAARTMLQRYLGAALSADQEAFGWVLDDDMRITERSLSLLRWLPDFRSSGADVLIGGFEGESPNTSFNGLRVQLLDLVYNLHWLRGLDHAQTLPNRAVENADLRRRFPDYYYDLSRKHTGHLETPYWLEAASECETVSAARGRLLAAANEAVRGAVLTRPVLVEDSGAPLQTARPTVNRGGNTFILNRRALLETPNMSPTFSGRESRRSDMIWSVVNRYHRKMRILSVGFPVLHAQGAKYASPFNVEKLKSEITGAVFFGSLSSFLENRPEHSLSFTQDEIGSILRLTAVSLAQRLSRFEQNFYRLTGLMEVIRCLPEADALERLLSDLERILMEDTLTSIMNCSDIRASDEIGAFLASMRSRADAFAASPLEMDELLVQLRISSCRS